MNVTDLPARIAAKIAVDVDGCWIWTGARNPEPRPYGQVGWEGRVLKAHRVVYELLVGPIPEGLHLDHLCRRPPCVNPLHLEPVTNRENCLRGEGPFAQRARQTHCAHGHEFTPENTHVRVTSRICRTCVRLRSRRRRAELRST